MASDAKKVAGKAAEAGKGGLSVGKLLLALVLLGIAAAALFFVFGRGAGGAPALPSYLSSNATVPAAFSQVLAQNSTAMAGLSSMIADHINGTQQFHVNYSGVAYVKLSGSLAAVGAISAPVAMWIAKYDTDRHLSASAESILGAINVQQLSLSNGTYVCTNLNVTAAQNGNVGGINGNPHCSAGSGINGFDLTPLYSFNFSKLQYAGITFAVAQSYQSTYGGEPCTAVLGTLGGAVSGRFAMCMSDQYYVPLSIGINASGQGGDFSIVLNETDIGNSSVQGVVDTIPYTLSGGASAYNSTNTTNSAAGQFFAGVGGCRDYANTIASGMMANCDENLTEGNGALSVAGPAGQTEYFCVGSNIGNSSVSWTQDAGIGGSSIGHQSGSTCTVNGAGTNITSIAAVGLLNPPQYTILKSIAMDSGFGVARETIPSDSPNATDGVVFSSERQYFSTSYTVTQDNSFVLVAVSCSSGPDKFFGQLSEAGYCTPCTVPAMAPFYENGFPNPGERLECTKSDVPPGCDVINPNLLNSWHYSAQPFLNISTGDVSSAYGAGSGGIGVTQSYVLACVQNAGTYQIGGMFQPYYGATASGTGPNLTYYNVTYISSVNLPAGTQLGNGASYLGDGMYSIPGIFPPHTVSAVVYDFGPVGHVRIVNNYINNSA